MKRAKIGSMLSPNELLDIANTMYGSRNMKRFIEDMADNGVEPDFRNSRRSNCIFI